MDSNQLFDAITYGKQTTEKGLTVGISAAKKVFKNKNVLCIVLTSRNASLQIISVRRLGMKISSFC